MNDSITSSLDSRPVDESQTESLTTSDYLQKIEYNTRMSSLGIAHIFSIGIVLIAGIATWIIIKRWFYGGV